MESKLEKSTTPKPRLLLGMTIDERKAAARRVKARVHVEPRGAIGLGSTTASAHIEWSDPEAEIERKRLARDCCDLRVKYPWRLTLEALHLDIDWQSVRELIFDRAWLNPSGGLRASRVVFS